MISRAVCSPCRSVYFAFEKKARLLILASFMMGISISSPVVAENKDVRISKTDQPPKIDGRLNDPAWQTCEKYGGFIQFDPFNGKPAGENTTVMVAYNEDNLYAAFQCDDREPSQIAAFLTPREQFDTGLEEENEDDETGRARANDCVTLVLDTFHDRRTSYSFTVNPKGVQKDLPGDYLWQSAAQITATGWQAEIRIPFKSIRFPKGEVRAWGINVERYIFRLKETDCLTQVGRDDVFLDKSAALVGMQQIRGGKNLEFFPYTGFRKSRSGGKSDQKFAVGLDAKYALTSELNLDVTMSPDFSEVESDPFFYQLSPYEYQLQEQRPFFQEGSRYFPAVGHESSLFYSKRINDPRIAGKISGRQGLYTIGAIGAVNKETMAEGEGEDDEGDGEGVADTSGAVGRGGTINATIGAFSLQRDVFKFSKVGTMFSGYSRRDFQNVNGLVHFDLRLSQIFSWNGSVQFSHNSDVSDLQNKMVTTSVRYEPDEGLGGFIDFQRTEKNFRPRAGIWRESDQQRMMVHPTVRMRLNKNGVKQIESDGFCEIKQTAEGTPLGYSIQPVDAKLTTLENHTVSLEVRFGRSKVQLRKDGSLVWHDRYFQERSVQVGASYEGSRFFQFNASFELSKRPVYNSVFTEAFDGRQAKGQLRLALRPNPTVKFNVGTEYTRQSREEGKSVLFEGALNTVGVHWQITRYFFFSTNLQHDSYEHRMKIDALAGVELGMGNTLSLSYKSRGRMPIRKAIAGDEASTLLLKASYLFRM